MHSGYRHTSIQQLRDQQVRFAPREKKLEQVDLAEKLVNEIDPQRSYTYEYICFRVTGYRPEVAPQELISGEDAMNDLRMLIEDISDAANIRVEDVPEPVRTVNQLGEMFSISTKTISRWRQQGLVSRRFIFDGRKRVGFLQSSVDRFVARNRSRVERGARFSQLTDLEKDEIIHRARRLARAGGCPSDITRRIAEHMGRSVETIRYTLKEFDKSHPEMAIFPDKTGPLIDSAKDDIYREYRLGKQVEQIARKHCRTKASIYRVVSEMRAKRINELPLDFMPNDSFKKRNAGTVILTPMPAADKPFRKVKVPAGLPPYLASLYEVPLLTREQEQHLFRKFNFLKYRANKLRDQLNPIRPSDSSWTRLNRITSRQWR